MASGYRDPARDPESRRTTAAVSHWIAPERLEVWARRRLAMAAMARPAPPAADSAWRA